MYFHVMHVHKTLLITVDHMEFVFRKNLTGTNSDMPFTLVRWPFHLKILKKKYTTRRWHLYGNADDMGQFAYRFCYFNAENVMSSFHLYQRKGF